MLLLLLFWAIFLLFFLPSLLLLWKVPNGKRIFLVQLLIYGIGNIIYATLISGNTSDDLLRWKSEPLWFVALLPLEVFVATLFSLAWKIASLQEIPIAKKHFYFTGFFILSLLISVFLFAIIDFTPGAEWIWRGGISFAAIFLILSGVFMVNELLPALKNKVAPSVVIALVIIIPAYAVATFILGKGAVLGSETFFSRELKNKLETPDGNTNFYFYQNGPAEYSVINIFTADKNSVTMKNIYYGGSYRDLEIKSVTNENLIFEYKEYYHSGGFLGIFGGTSGSWTRQVNYEISSGNISVDKLNN